MQMQMTRMPIHCHPHPASASLLHLLVLNQFQRRLFRQIHMTFVVHQHARRRLRTLPGIRRTPASRLPSAVVSPGFTSSRWHKLGQQFLAAAQHARNAAADPHALLAQRMLLLRGRSRRTTSCRRLRTDAVRAARQSPTSPPATPARYASCTMCSAGSVTARLSGYFGNSARIRSRISSVNTGMRLTVINTVSQRRKSQSRNNHE